MLWYVSKSLVLSDFMHGYLFYCSHQIQVVHHQMSTFFCSVLYYLHTYTNLEFVHSQYRRQVYIAILKLALYEFKILLFIVAAII